MPGQSCWQQGTATSVCLPSPHTPLRDDAPRPVWSARAQLAPKSPGSACGFQRGLGGGSTCRLGRRLQTQCKMEALKVWGAGRGSGGVAFQVACAGEVREPGRRPLPGPGPRRTRRWFCEEDRVGILWAQPSGAGSPSSLNHVSPGLPAADINECLSISPSCPAGHTCINTEGSYTCQKNVPNCGRGYHLNGEGTRCVGGY